MVTFDLFSYLFLRIHLFLRHLERGTKPITPHAPSVLSGFRPTINRMQVPSSTTVLQASILCFVPHPILFFWITHKWPTLRQTGTRWRNTEPVSRHCCLQLQNNRCWIGGMPTTHPYHWLYRSWAETKKIYLKNKCYRTVNWLVF